jgi:Holliday junction resolvase RusA-like endonuclease
MSFATLTAALLPLLFAMGDPGTKSANALIAYGSYRAKNVKLENFMTSGVLTLKESYHLSNPFVPRASCRCHAAKNAKTVKSKQLSSSVPGIREEDEWYWVDENSDDNLELTFRDENRDEDDQEGCDSKRILKLRFKICGNPRPLQRHRTSKFRTYNPSMKYQKSFQDAFEKLILDLRHEGIDTPLFSESEYLAMSIVFRMKRPKNHFVNSKPGPGRLKEKSPSQLSSIRSDVDNLTKFVLDSLNGVLYDDDRQITSIHATKLLDSEDLCRGSIEVYVRSIEVEDVEKILESSISIFEQDTEE